jgi:hypothetical protein
MRHQREERSWCVPGRLGRSIGAQIKCRNGKLCSYILLSAYSGKRGRGTFQGDSGGPLARRLNAETVSYALTFY